MILTKKIYSHDEWSALKEAAKGAENAELAREMKDFTPAWNFRGGITVEESQAGNRGFSDYYWFKIPDECKDYEKQKKLEIDAIRSKTRASDRPEEMYSLQMAVQLVDGLAFTVEYLKARAAAEGLASVHCEDGDNQQIGERFVLFTFAGVSMLRNHAVFRQFNKDYPLASFGLKGVYLGGKDGETPPYLDAMPDEGNTDTEDKINSVARFCDDCCNQFRRQSFPVRSEPTEACTLLKRCWNLYARMLEDDYLYVATRVAKFIQDYNTWLDIPFERELMGNRLPAEIGKKAQQSKKQERDTKAAAWKATAIRYGEEISGFKKAWLDDDKPDKTAANRAYDDFRKAHPELGKPDHKTLKGYLDAYESPKSTTT